MCNKDTFYFLFFCIYLELLELDIYVKLLLMS